MKIVVGSKNPTKIKAVQEIFPEADVASKDVPSKVSAQPFSDIETREGAINRAKQCKDVSSGSIGIGLEGGVMHVEDELYLCNWGALVTEDEQVFTASGARIVLPKEIDEELQRGIELGDIMDHYASRDEVRKKEGAIGIFTKDRISRQEMFSHVVKMLRGQWEYWSKE
ncbi:DUF84 family protein [Oceanobacillus halophilus]|uniref:inosine/xanthosine triphosphatase n=1 Tax=Oceanobacillus halophilus TaxID=930130 RepID=A0A494ZWT0_9BACI|nr:DUF84 family protein [Oceanobacillus halophilus]RKQ30524.1 DUF84 family protein [Oceanobacillus halophilus]